MTMYMSKCKHGMLDERFCSLCHPPAKPVKSPPAEKRPPVPAGFAHPTDSIDPLSCPSFSESDPRGMHTCDGIIVHRSGLGSHATVKVRDFHGRAMTTTVPRAMWAVAACCGLVEHATEDEDLKHDFAGCPSELVNDVGCRYSCADWRHFKKQSRPSSITIERTPLTDEFREAIQRNIDIGRNATNP